MNRLQTTQRFGAHEFLETQEALRTKAANIELYGVLINDAQDAHLRDILTNQQRRMVQSFQSCVGLLANRGVQAQTSVPHTPQVNVYEQPQIGLNNPTFPQLNPNAKQLSDWAIASIALNLHKAGSVFAMQWANECAAPEIRGCHVTSANTCQEMAYELFQYMNYKGQYQVPQLADHTMNTMIQAFQGVGVGAGAGFGGGNTMGAGYGGTTGTTSFQGVSADAGTNFGSPRAFHGQAARFNQGEYDARY